MKVKDVIRNLSRLEPEAELYINVRVCSQAWGVAQCPIQGDSLIDGSYGGAAIHVWLPKGMHVVQRKKQ